MPREGRQAGDAHQTSRLEYDQATAKTQIRTPFNSYSVCHSGDQQRTLIWSMCPELRLFEILPSLNPKS